jgi:carbamoyltransferase
MKVLGLSYGFHDSAAALVADGKIVAACQQERLSRIKNDAGFPEHAIQFCLSEAGLRASDLDAIAYYEIPLLKFDRIARAWFENPSGSETAFKQTVARWLRDGRFEVREFISSQLGVPVERVHTCFHHQSHAASAYFCSPFESATIVTLDGVGEYETASISIGEGSSIRRLVSVSLPHSIGLFYSAFTAYLGFQVNEGEYKVMGMSAFGRPRFKNEISKLFTLNDDGSFALDQSAFAFDGMSELPYNRSLLKTFGPPRVPGAPFGVDRASLPSTLSGIDEDDLIAQSRHYADVAASVQAVTEDVIRHVVARAVKLTGIPRVAMSGGVALNSLANGRLLRDDGYEMFIQPAAGDAGSALGAALHHWHFAGEPRIRPLTDASLGPRYDRDRVRHAAQQSGYKIELDTNDEELFLRKTAERIANGAVIGWLNGRSEWGPRALGHRSILADPRRAEMQRLVNEKVKFREPFRPFAPAVPAEEAHRYFELPAGAIRRGAPEAFMLAVHPVLEQHKSVLPATTHADGTSRIQAVHAEDQPVFHRLLTEFGKIGGVPVLLNTSFNLNGEPIVESPENAVRTFSLSGIDILCMQGVILSKQLEQEL